MEANFQSKLNDLEARLKAENESSRRRERNPRTFEFVRTSPKRPKPLPIPSYDGACSSPPPSGTRSPYSSSPSPNFLSRPQSFSPTPSSGYASRSASSPSPSPGSRPLAGSPSPGARPLASSPSPGARPLASSPSPGARPFASSPSPGARPLAGSPSPGSRSLNFSPSPSRPMAFSPTPFALSSSPSSSFNSSRPQNITGFGRSHSQGQFTNSNQSSPSFTPRTRRSFTLPMSPAKQQDTELDQKYTEIMKQTGILTLSGEKVRTEVGDLEALGELGAGTSGHVLKMKHTKTGHLIAVKQMRRSGNREENKRIMMDLDVVLKCSDCPFIVQCLGTFITGSDVWICMELMTTCFDKLSKKLRAPIPEPILGKSCVSTLKALNYLKEVHGVIHRDVKPSNILLDNRGRVKLCDFGISGRLVDSKAKTRSAGCAAYMAPERIDPPDPTKPDYDVRADVWSLGISLVELATGGFPYPDCKNDFEVLAQVLELDPPTLPTGRGFSMDFCSFVTQCLTKDCTQRPKYRKLLEHNFIHRSETSTVDVAYWFAQVRTRINLDPT